MSYSKAWSANMSKLLDHIDGKRTMREEYDLVKSKESTLPHSMRQFVLELFKEP